MRDAPIDDLEKRLTFKVFENGANDLVYEGGNFGMWSQGEFELPISPGRNRRRARA